MHNPRDRKAWLRAVARHMNLSLSELALKSGLAASTVTRYMNDATGRLSITERSVEAISRFSGVPQHVLPGEKSVPGLGESEAIPYETYTLSEPLPDWVRAAVEAARSGRNGVHAWIMKGWALDLLGVLPGDVLMIDQNRRPRSGDVVCVQLTDAATGGVETVFRRYEPPYVVGHSAKMGVLRPELVDDDRVVIMGVETGIIRPRH